MKRKPAILFLALALCLPVFAEEEVSLFDLPPQQGQVTPAPSISPLPSQSPAPQGDPAAREQLIDQIIGLAESLYQKTNGRAQKADSAGDIYVCKNFTTYIFRAYRDEYALAEFPGQRLLIPNNLPPGESKPYSYGIAWEDIAPGDGNPFYAAHSFYYDTAQSGEENRLRALQFMREVKRGDFFQMSADYYYGVGAHSAIFTRDYDPVSNMVAWTDSNMKGESRGGVRYGYVQFNAQKDIEWFVDAFCHRGRGATLYRLRDDIIRK